MNTQVGLAQDLSWVYALSAAPLGSVITMGDCDG